MHPMKHIPLQGAHNFRDLGGYPTADGRVTRWGILYRSDALADLTGADWEILKKRKVKTIIDLRSRMEADTAKITPPEGIARYHFSLMRELDENKVVPDKETIIESMKLDYVKTLTGNLSCAAEILNTILERMDVGAVVFLCSAGKDRTGIITALVLYLCGVSREDIIADYMVSSIYNANGINKKLSGLPEEYRKAFPPKLLEECLPSRPETIETLLDVLDAGEIRKNLERQGFSKTAAEQLCKRFTEQSDECHDTDFE